ncbi:MAG: hypothetical protein WA433_03405 [Desulfobaccales bacterium]
MKKLSILLILAIFLGVGMIGAMPGLSQAQVYAPPPGPVASAPYVGPNTPWVYYNGDWFLNGILYYFFGPRYGWGPYYAYPETFVVRPGQWYGPKWDGWYRAHPVFWKNFQHAYPHWRGHVVGRHYGEEFYNRYHSGQGGGWHHGVPGHEFHRP